MVAVTPKLLLWLALNAAFLAAVYAMPWSWRIGAVVALLSGAVLEVLFAADTHAVLRPIRRQATVPVPAPLPRVGHGLLRSLDRDLSVPGAAEGAPPQPDAGSPLRVVTWNVERGFQLPRIVAHLNALTPDIALLQEVDVDCARSGHVDVAAEVARACGMPYVYFTNEYFVASLNRAAKLPPGQDSTGQPLHRPKRPEPGSAAARAAAAADDTGFDEQKLKPQLRNLFGAHGNAIVSRYPFVETWHYTLPCGRSYYGGLPDDADADIPAADADSDVDDDLVPDADGRPTTGMYAAGYGLSATPRSMPFAGSYKPSDPRYHRRSIALARIVTPHAGTVLVASVHLEASYCGARGRARQFHALMRSVAAHRKPGDALVLGGDFNTMSNGYRRWIYKFACDDLRWNSLGMTEAEWFAANVLARHYPYLHDPTLRQCTLRILLGALADDKLDFLLFDQRTFRLATADERRQQRADARAGAATTRNAQLYARRGTKPPVSANANASDAAAAAEQSWAIDGYGSSDHCYVCFDLVRTALNAGDAAVSMSV